MIVSRKSKNDPKLKWFDEARFGMFVHFGLHSLLGRGEWVMYKENIPRIEYEKLMQKFNPVRFNADEWVTLAQESGARYITVTAKHHDGFCLFDSKLTDFKITNTPFGRDIIRELAEACHLKKMPLVIYYSQPDWHHPNFVHRKKAFKDLQPQPSTDEPNWSRYQEYLEGQILELVTNYGKIHGIWFDGSHKSEKEWRGKRLYRLIKKHQPQAVVNDRGRYGDFFTPERRLPDDLSGFLFEACQSISTNSWGYKKDTILFSSPYLIENLVRMAAKGGNYLLNVGPMPDGTIPLNQVVRMQAIGQWLRINEDAIYGTKPCNLIGIGDAVAATRKNNDIYLHFLQWPAANQICIEGIKSEPASVNFIGSKCCLAASITDKGLEIKNIPMEPANALPQVMKLGFDSAPILKLQLKLRIPKHIVTVHSSGKTLLPARYAVLHGRGIKGSSLNLNSLELSGTTCIAGWLDLSQKATWHIECSSAGRYNVYINLACEALYAGSEFVIKTTMGKIKGTVQGTTSWEHFQKQYVGTLEFAKGKSYVCLKPLLMPYAYLFANVASIELRACP